MNLLLSDVEEKITTYTNDETDSGKINTEKKNFSLLFLRGDLVIVLIPSNK